MYLHLHTSTCHGHGRGDSGGALPVLLPLQPSSQVCCSLLLWGPSKCWASCADTLVCISLLKHKCFHSFSLDRVGCTVLLAGCLLPACTSVQIKNLAWHIGWWYYLLSLGETAGEGKWLKTEMSYWDSYFWKQWGRSAPGVGKCHIIPTQRWRKNCEVIVSGNSSWQDFHTVLPILFHR